MKLSRFIEVLQNAKEKIDSDPPVFMHDDKSEISSIIMEYDETNISIIPLSDSENTVNILKKINRESIS